MDGASESPELSIVVVVFNMAREARRTLASLSPQHQNVDPARYEVIVVDNGSAVPLASDVLSAGGPVVRYARLEPPASPSPASAVNLGARLARAPLLGIVVDGARMASPGLVATALQAARLHDDPVITTLAWHLGPDVQARSAATGYDRHAEDRLLRSIDWPADGYGLFEISTLAPASARGFLSPLPECSALFVPSASFAELGGFDERFAQPGGGFASGDFFRRAMERPGVLPVMLLGEGTFHQVHDRAGPYDRQALHGLYQELRGRRFEPPHYRPVLFGDPHPATLRHLARSAVMAANTRSRAVPAAG